MQLGQSGTHADLTFPGNTIFNHLLRIEALTEKVLLWNLYPGRFVRWCTETKTKHEQGGVVRFTFGPDYFREMKIIQLKPFQVVKRVCLVAYKEWIGTNITFELQRDGNTTVLTFQDNGGKESMEGLPSPNHF